MTETLVSNENLYQKKGNIKINPTLINPRVTVRTLGKGYISQIPSKHSLQKSASVSESSSESKVCKVKDIDYYERKNGVEIFESQHVNEIYRNLKKREEYFLLRSDYFLKQKEINTRMRTTLVDWIYTSCVDYFHTTIETFFLTVQILDHYCSIDMNIKKFVRS